MSEVIQEIDFETERQKTKARNQMNMAFGRGQIPTSKQTNNFITVTPGFKSGSQELVNVKTQGFLSILD